MKRLVFIPQDIAESGKVFLKERNYELLIGESTEEKYLLKGIKECDALIARIGRFHETVLKEAKNLKIIARHGVGVDNIDLEYAKKHNIRVANDPISNTNAVAEQVLAFIIGSAKSIVSGHNLVLNGEFSKRNLYLNQELKGKTLGIIGMGKIGRLLAKKAYFGLDMKVVYYDPFSVSSPEGSESIGLDDLLKTSDFISLNMPYSDEVHHFIGEKEFLMMKSTAFFINCARGELVNERALYKALKEKKIAGCALDVFEEEPPKKDNPLFDLSNVLLSPHNAALTVQAMNHMSLEAAKRIDEYFSGKEVFYLVV